MPPGKRKGEQLPQASDYQFKGDTQSNISVQVGGALESSKALQSKFLVSWKSLFLPSVRLLVICQESLLLRRTLRR
jgi:hypothetical protein